MAVKTLNDLFNDYNAILVASNTNINAGVVGTDWYVKGKVLSAMLTIVYQDILQAQNAIYLQSASGFQLDLQLRSYGFTPRQAATFALVYTKNGTPYPSTSYLVAAGTTFTSAFNGKSYILQSDVTVETAGDSFFDLISSLSGTGTQLPTGSTLTTTVDSQSLVVTVLSSTDGQPTETNDQVSARISNNVKNPIGAAREQQYVLWSREANSNVANAIVIGNFDDGSPPLKLAIFLLGFGTNYDDILLTPSLFTRTVTNSVERDVYGYLNSLRLINVNLLISSVSTWVFSDNLNIAVTLIPGLTLATLVPNFNGAPISVQNFIIQEIRRAFITYQYQGTAIDATTDRYILLSQIAQGLDSSLSVENGIYG